MITVDLNRVHLKKGYKILDTGCGSGRHMAAVYEIMDVTVVGSDLCFEDLKLASERMKFHDKLIDHSCKQWNLILSDITCLPFDNDSFDLVICSEVLEHVKKDKVAIDELVRVLKVGKSIIITVPRYFHEKICWMMSSEYTKGSQRHLRIYRKRKLVTLLESYGLECYDSHYSHSLHTPFWWLKCMVGLNNTDSFLLNLYHRFLVWDIMKQPKLIRLIDRVLNPILGKSLVLYACKKKGR